MSEPDILCELIADCRHVSPTLMRMLYHAKGPDGIALVTDAAAGAGLAEGERFHIGEIEGVVENDVAVTADGKALCSSTATMDRLVRNMVQVVGAPLHEAVRMATLNPARALRIAERKGVLAAGADADLVVLTDDLQVSETYVAGDKGFGPVPRAKSQEPNSSAPHRGTVARLPIWNALEPSAKSHMGTRHGPVARSHLALGSNPCWLSPWLLALTRFWLFSIPCRSATSRQPLAGRTRAAG